MANSEVLDFLRAMQAQITDKLDRVARDLGELKEHASNSDIRATLLEQHFALLVAQLPLQSDRFAALDKRIQRIERRLELIDAPH